MLTSTRRYNAALTETETRDAQILMLQAQLDQQNQLFSEQQGMRPGIPSCAVKPVATYAAAAPQYHSPAASAGA